MSFRNNNVPPNRLNPAFVNNFLQSYTLYCVRLGGFRAAELPF